MVDAAKIRGTLALILVLMTVLGGLSAVAENVQTASCTTALLVIDVQHIWLRGLLFTVDNVYIRDKVAELLPLARGAGIPVVYIVDVRKRGSVSEAMLGMPSVIAPQEGDHVSEKTLGNAFSYTDLHDVLQDLGITRVLISGLASQSCVSATVAGAQIKGYEVVILEDGHSGGQNGKMAEQQNRIWASQGLDVINSKELDWIGQCPIGNQDEDNT